MPRSIGGLNTWASSDQDLFLAAFITNIAEPEFSAHTGVLRGALVWAHWKFILSEAAIANS